MLTQCSDRLARPPSLPPSLALIGKRAPARPPQAYGAELSIPVFGKFSDRQTFLIDSTGVVRAHWLERDGSMASVKTPEHVNQILAAIKEL